MILWENFERLLIFGKYSLSNRSHELYLKIPKIFNLLSITDYEIK